MTNIKEIQDVTLKETNLCMHNKIKMTDIRQNSKTILTNKTCHT